jgi:NAD(P)-dependent dehydrogenase (short-subunit alcohol dehydrogenase family)
MSERFKHLFSLTGRVAMVTGAAGLLGRAFAEALAAHGASIVAVDISGEKAAAAAAEIECAYGVSAEGFAVDVCCEAAIDAVVAAVIAKFGRIDVLVNSAYPPAPTGMGRFPNLTSADWQAYVSGHLTACYVPSRRVFVEMQSQRDGSIIGLGSIYGVVAPDFSIYDGTAMTMPAPYSAVKSGIVSFMRYLSTSGAAHGIRANAVSPGGIENGQPASFIANYSKRTPLGRMGQPDDIVGAVVYLASPAGRYTTGQNLVIDGGWSAW